MQESNIVSSHILNRDLIVPPNIINRNIDTSLNNILKRRIEEKCIDVGYVIKGSVKIVKRSAGLYDKYNNDGNFKYNIDYNVFICRPHKEDIIECVVEDTNKAGIIANKMNAGKYPVNIKVIIPTEYFKMNKLDIASINIGDPIFCQVIASRFKYDDNSILVIARGV
jgi:DNA-directed RNA polymerase subunit E'/Rpb7